MPKSGTQNTRGWGAAIITLDLSPVDCISGLSAAPAKVPVVSLSKLLYPS